MTASRMGPQGGGPVGRASGGSIMAGPPPGTAMRGPGGAGPPPSSAYKRTGTANNQRPGTQSSANGPAGVRTGTTVTVDSRPITNHGLTGVKPGGGGGGRQVLDKTYFVNELRQKRTEVANKTAEMRVSGGSCNASQSILGGLMHAHGCMPFARGKAHRSVLGMSVSLCQGCSCHADLCSCTHK